MGRDVIEDEPDRVGEGARREDGVRGEEGVEVYCSFGRGKKNLRGLRGNLERRGGLRTLRYMLKERRARLECGTYLGCEVSGVYVRGNVFGEVDGGRGWWTHLLAYAIFSEYIPLAKNRTRVVTLTNSRPLAMYG